MEFFLNLALFRYQYPSLFILSRSRYFSRSVFFEDQSQTFTLEPVFMVGVFSQDQNTLKAQDRVNFLAKHFFIKIQSTFIFYFGHFFIFTAKIF